MAQRRSSKKFDNHPTIPFDDWDLPSMPEAEPKDALSAGIPPTSAENIESAMPESAEMPALIADASQFMAPEAEISAETEMAMSIDAADRRLYYISLGSGSSGNCSYLGTRKGGILIDAGVKADKVEERLAANEISMKMVKAIILTHDHSDHVRYAYTLLRTHKHIRLFCTNRVLTGILRRTSISKRIKEYHHAIFKEIPFKIAEFEITAFEVPHDSSDSMGFFIEFDNRRFVIATDLGEIRERARHYISQANYLVIETNYDLQMLRFGRYPEHLKARIQTAIGHLDNVYTAAFLKQIVNPELKYIFLCHLSQENNTPQKAYSAVRDALLEAGKKIGSGENTLSDRKADVQLVVLPRLDATRLYVFNPDH